MTKTPLLIYLHGFNSSSQSAKAQQTIDYVHKNKLDIDLWVPDLPTDLDTVRQCLSDRIQCEQGIRPVYIIGSSLGGYLGTWLMQRLTSIHPHITTRLVLVNPAVRPYELFHDYLGKQIHYHTGEEWELTMSHIESLKTFETFSLDKASDILLLVQTGDETLDYRMAVEKYSGAHHIIQQGGNHSFAEYETMLPAVFDFFSGQSVL